MAVKKNSGKTELRQWMDEQYRTSPGLKERVEALGAQVKILLEKSEPTGRARRTKRKLAKTA